VNVPGLTTAQIAEVQASESTQLQGVQTALAAIQQAAQQATAMVTSSPGAVDQGQDASSSQATANALTSLADSNLLTDDTLLTSLQGQAASLLAQSPQLANAADTIWNGALQGMKEGAIIGGTIAAIDIALAEVGFTALSDILAALVAEIAAIITQALITMGVTTVTASTIAGGSTFGYVGAIIGAIIGACIAAIEVLTGGPSVQITNGHSYHAGDYVSNNLKSASDWLTANQDKIVGLTALHFANQANIFLANPTWLWINQGPLGITQPTPPDQGTGSPVDTIYVQLPGAFELLNRAQYLAAISLVNTTPQHLAFYQSIPIPGTVTPTQDATQYKPIYSPTVLTWGLGEAYQRGQIYGTQNWSASGFLYTACPNLLTNDCTIGPDGKVTSQTNISPGSYALQVLYPTLTSGQCEKIFAACTSAYNPAVNLLPPSPPVVNLALIHYANKITLPSRGKPAATAPVPQVPQRSGVPVSKAGAQAAPAGAQKPTGKPGVSANHFTTNPPPSSGASSAAPLVVGAAAVAAFMFLRK